jgi:hypothetical protein
MLLGDESGAGERCDRRRAAASSPLNGTNNIADTGDEITDVNS